MEIESNETVEQSGNGTQDSSPESFATDSSSDSNNQTVAQALAELDKMEKFKFEGQEWTPKDLKAAILRQKDYTLKTKSLAEERKSLEEDRKYSTNLYYDLRHVQANPSLASEFIKIYPEKYHSYLKEVLQSTRAQASQAQPAQSQPEQTRYQPDVELLSRLGKLESVLEKQEVAKNSVEIKSHMTTFAKKYPDAVEKVVLANIYEARKIDPNLPINAETFEKAFKESDAEMKQLLKSRYGDLQRKQIEANKKARDVESGGGTPGRAPEKFKSLKDVTRFAVEDLTRK